MSLGEILAVVPKDWRAPIVVASLVTVIAIATLGARAKAEELIEDRVSPIRKAVKMDHALIRHMFEHIEQDAVLHGQMRKHTIADVKKEADQFDDGD